MSIVRSVALHHTCFIVRDVEKRAQAPADSLGMGPWNVWTIEPTESTIRGEPNRFSFRVALASVGSGTCELQEAILG